MQAGNSNAAAARAQLHAALIAGDNARAEALLPSVLAADHDAAAHRETASLFASAGRVGVAERILRDALARAPGDLASAFQLAALLQEQGRTRALADVLVSAVRPHAGDAAATLRAARLLFDCGKLSAAAEVIEGAIAAGAREAAVHAYAGMLDLQLGRFAAGRGRYAALLQGDVKTGCEWQAPAGMAVAQCYADPAHPDFALFRACLARTDLSDAARASLLFALGKASDDVADYATAARCFRDGNAIAHRTTRWSIDAWHEAVRVHQRLAFPGTPHLASTPAFRPVFIVGMPRSGSTLLANLLARDPAICNRGELAGLPLLAAQLAQQTGIPKEALAQIATFYETYARQDDTAAQWFIDKHPLNFLNVGLIRALWPHARVIWTTRAARDTALSLWSHAFAGNDVGFAYAFDDIAAVMDDCTTLLAPAASAHPDIVRVVRYASLVDDPEGTIAGIRAWAGLPAQPATVATGTPEHVGTASLWQARQPINRRSLGRWRHYIDLIPELARFPDQPPG